ncbi:hypothetical protein J562_4462, partial [Acinetobacter baumannii 1440750]
MPDKPVLMHKHYVHLGTMHHNFQQYDMPQEVISQ